MDLKDLRIDFGNLPFNEQELGDEPVTPLKQWITEALEKKIPNGNAMILSTCAKGVPSSRVVLLKELTPEGHLIFFTDYSSRKGKELTHNPHVSVLFYWEILERQIRIEGTASKVPEQLSEQYFNSRPLESRASAMVSQQSKPIKSLEPLLEQRNFLLKNKEQIERPERWGGYAVSPHCIEFWQGGAYRLHHRIRFELKKSGWSKTRLAP